MREKAKIEIVEKFIFNDKVQNILSEINDNVMDFNILEITGMGTQEIKHSNILEWLFDDSEHNLEYQILDGFLKKVIQQKGNDSKELKSYLYLSNKKRDITIYREKDNIDLLIVDEANKVVITIENKINANERTKGNDGGQLLKYETIINDKYSEKKWNKYFIFLTKDLEEALGGKEEWLEASHQMTVEVIEDVLTAKEITAKTKIILESYVDLLKRNDIVADKNLEELCGKIWANKDYADALDVLIEYRLTPMELIYRKILNKRDENTTASYVFLQLEGITRLYNYFKDKPWEESESIFELDLYYDQKDDSVNLQYYYKDLKSQNNQIKELCNKIIPIGTNRTKTEIMKRTRDNIVDNNIDAVVESFIKKIDEIDKEIVKILNQT